jgi:class 3 adenylate cyclase
MALISFMMILCEVQRSFKLSQFCNRVEVVKQLGNSYKTNVGFGLHYGWAVTGPIGSEMKVDASFIGHDVTLASTLEAVSKNYGVKILFTGEFWSYLTDETRALTRRID